MGYDVYVSGEWEVAADKAEAALNELLQAVAEQDCYDTIDDWVAKEEPIPDPRENALDYLENRLDELRWYYSDDKPGFQVAFPDGDSVRNEDEQRWVFETIAPFVNEDDTLYFEGEDGYKWVWEAKGGKLEEHGGETVYGQEVKAGTTIDEIIKVIYPEHLDGKPVSAVFDYGDLEYEDVTRKIENILREAGFGPQAGKSELERLADV